MTSRRVAARDVAQFMARCQPVTSRGGPARCASFEGEQANRSVIDHGEWHDPAARLRWRRPMARRLGGPDRGAGAGSRKPCHRDARRPRPARGLHPFRLRQPRRSQRRASGAGGARLVRRPQSVHREGPGAAGSACPAHLGEQCDHRIRGREPDGARLRRAVHALWAAREERRDGRRAHACDLHARSGGALLGRQTRDGRGRGVHVAAAARSRPAEPPHLLFQGHQG